MNKIVLFILLIVAIVGLSGCASKENTMALAPKGQKIETPKDGKAQIVFMRPSILNGAVNFSVFEIIDGEPFVIATLAPYSKVVHSLEEGTHTFMVNFTGADSALMEVTAKAGKIYYSYMAVHAGFFSTSISFEPYDKSVSMKDINEYLNSCDLVVMNHKTQQWATKHQRDIRANYKEALEEWNDEDDKDRVRLLASDGR